MFFKVFFKINSFSRFLRPLLQIPGFSRFSKVFPGAGHPAKRECIIFGLKLYCTLYNSVANTCKFLSCIVTDLSLSKSCCLVERVNRVSKQLGGLGGRCKLPQREIFTFHTSKPSTSYVFHHFAHHNVNINISIFNIWNIILHKIQEFQNPH